MKYRKKPVVIDAVQCKEPNTIADIMTFCPSAQPSDGGDNGLQWVWIETLEGTMTANYGDYVIKGVKGEFYPCKPDIFEATYEKAEDAPKNIAE